MEVNKETKVVAPLIYKVIMRLATLDENATVTALHANLHELTQYAIIENGNSDNIPISIKIMPKSRLEVNQ